MPNPGGGEEDACDAAEHFGKLVVNVIACLMIKCFYYSSQNCSVEMPNPKGNVYCEVTNVMGKWL